MKHEEQGPQSELEALVCAYVLGQVDADEGRAVEEALAASAELRAHRDELERTIGFVRETFDERERMSDAATGELLQRVEDRPRLAPSVAQQAADSTLPAWMQSPYWRTAAALLFVVGVTAVYRAGRGARAPQFAQRANSPELSESVAGKKSDDGAFVDGDEAWTLLAGGRRSREGVGTAALREPQQGGSDGARGRAS